MAAMTPNEGLKEMMEALVLDEAEPGDLEIFLFSNDETIAAGTVKVDLTEIAANGCAAQDLTKASFGVSTLADPSVITFDSGSGVSWTVDTAAQTAYGWAICSKVGGKIWRANNWGAKTFQIGEVIKTEPLTFSMANA